MATKTIKHDGHEHEIRVVNETIHGLVINDTDTDTISGSFGWDHEKFDRVMKAFKAFDRFQDAAQDLNEDMPRSTRISVLADFLKSDTFKRLGIKISEPNDYFMLGFIFQSIRDTDGFEEFLKKGAFKIGTGSDLLELLKKLRKDLER